MDIQEKTQFKLSDEVTVSIDNFTKRLKEIPQFKIPQIKLSDDFVNALSNIKNIAEDFEEVAKKFAKSENKRESNFYYVREEEAFRYGARHWEEFKEWYKWCVMFNPAYHDTPIGYTFHTTDDVIRYTNPETNVTLKLIGVNSVSYELFFEYKEKCRKAQKQGLNWSYEEEEKRIEKFIKDVKVEQPKQLQDADESIKEKVIESLDERDIKKYFFKEADFIAFTDALATHFSDEEYILPQPIEMRWGGSKKTAKAVYNAFLSTKGTSLSEDIKLFDLMRVLSYFKKKDNKQIISAMQRTDG